MHLRAPRTIHAAASMLCVGVMTLTPVASLVAQQEQRTALQPGLDLAKPQNNDVGSLDFSATVSDLSRMKSRVAPLAAASSPAERAAISPAQLVQVRGYALKLQGGTDASLARRGKMMMQFLDIAGAKPGKNGTTGFANSR